MIRKHEFERGGVSSVIYLQDCMEAMKQYPDNHFDLAVVDPPYGIGADKAQNAGGEKWGYKKYKDTEWDSKIPSADYFIELQRVSKNQVVWGGNYMTEHLPPRMCWLLWDKGQRDFSLADGELAWTSFEKALRIFTMPRGTALSDANTNGGRIHPTQKPVKLYEWIFKNYAKEGDKILDTHLGSGSNRIAAYKAGLDFTGYEVDEDYFDGSIKRFENHVQQLTLL
jgi:site-specific DNA-methyltransferase (adenine-specific)